MRKILPILVSLAVLPASGNAADFGVFAGAGTFGFGGGVAININEHLGARVGYETFTYKVRDQEQSDLTLDGTAKIGGIKALLDWYPMGGSFHLTAGAISNQTRIDAIAKPMGGAYTIGGNRYEATDIGEARGSAKFDSIAPYVGLGFGRALSRDGHLAVMLDVGVALTGSPTVALSATCSNSAVCDNLAADIENERGDLQEDADQLNAWPILNVSVGYRF